MAFNEDTRVKIPAILHLNRLGYKYISLKEARWDIESNIFTEILMHSLTVEYPNEEVLKNFNSAISKYNEMILVNHNQNQHLASLRDWLLPMLMNGQVTVKEIEEKVNETIGNILDSRNIAAEPKTKYND